MKSLTAPMVVSQKGGSGGTNHLLVRSKNHESKDWTACDRAAIAARKKTRFWPESSQASRCRPDLAGIHAQPGNTAAPARAPHGPGRPAGERDFRDNVVSLAAGWVRHPVPRHQGEPP